MAASLGILVIRSSLVDWRSMKKSADMRGTGPLEPVACGIGSSPAGGKLGNFSTDFDLKNPTQSKHITSKPTSILLQDASSPRQQAKTMCTSAHVFIL
jgi:hypothetical protein